MNHYNDVKNIFINIFLLIISCNKINNKIYYLFVLDLKRT